MPINRLNHPPKECLLAEALAARLRTSREVLVHHWLERITARVTLPADQVFPTDELLDQVPILIDGIARYLEDPSAEVSAATPVVGKAIELGALRHSQGFDSYEIMKEYEVLGGILFHHLAHAVDDMSEPFEKSELLTCGQRLFRAITIIQQATTAEYLRLCGAAVAAREDRLRAFNRMVSHEIKNCLGAILGAADLLVTVPEMSDGQQLHYKQMVLHHARAMRATIQNLVELSRLDHDARAHRNVRLLQAAREAFREIREVADAAHVAVRIAEPLPNVEVNAAVVELALTNYLSNAIKYAKCGTLEAFVEISATESRGPGGPEIVVCVRDNGIGVPTEKRLHLFARFFRAHETVTAVEGTGLGLSIVREMVESAGGRAWAEFPDDGSTFFFSLPHRRAEKAESQSVSAAVR